jgi:hypothetical protein
VIPLLLSGWAHPRQPPALAPVQVVDFPNRKMSGRTEVDESATCEASAAHLELDDGVARGCAVDGQRT